MAIGPESLYALRDLKMPIVYIFAEKRLAPEKTDITGVDFNINPQMQLELIIENKPSVRKIGMIYSKWTKKYHDEVVRKAGTFGMKIISKKAGDPEEASRMISELLGSGEDNKIDAFLVHADLEIYTKERMKKVQYRANMLDIPVFIPSVMVSNTPEMDKAMSPLFETAGRQGANMGNQILDGKNINEIPGAFIGETVPWSNPSP